MSARRPGPDRYLDGGRGLTERENILLRQLGFVRKTLASMYRVTEDKWSRGTVLALLQAVSKHHPLLKGFYGKRESADTFSVAASCGVAAVVGGESRAAAVGQDGGFGDPD